MRVLVVPCRDSCRSSKLRQSYPRVKLVRSTADTSCAPCHVRYPLVSNILLDRKQSRLYFPALNAIATTNMSTILSSRASARNVTSTMIRSIAQTKSQRIPSTTTPRHFSSAPRFTPVFRPTCTSTKFLATSAAQQQHKISVVTAVFAAGRRFFSASTNKQATYNQVRRGCRKEQRARRRRSPALSNRPELKGVCLKTGITKPKKPNSGERKTARIRLSTGRVVTAYIPGEGHNVQQHSVVMVRGGRAQDCPGVKYHLVRGALDLVSYLRKEKKQQLMKNRVVLLLD